MSKRKRRLRALRDALARAIARRVSALMPGTYDLGVAVLSTTLGVRVAARIGDNKVQHTLWPWRLQKGLDAIVRDLVRAAERRQSRPEGPRPPAR